jgi:hypothetical protein
MPQRIERTLAEKQKILDLLKRIHLFKGISDSSLENITDRLVTRAVRSDERIFAEGQYAESFFIILEGQVQITRVVGKDETKVIANLIRGDYFGEVALLNHTLRTGTARAQTSTILLEMSNENFLWILEEFPDFRRDLLRVVSGYEIAQRKRFKWLREDETIHVLARRDVWILVYRIVMPAIIGLLSFWALFESFSVEAPVLRFLGVSGSVIALAWGAWAYIDWENDFYVVTDKRVVYVEKIILLYDSIQEAPLETILTINVSSANFIERLLGYGNITVETFGGKIQMQNVRDPKRVETALKEYWDRVTSYVKQVKDEEIRLEVRQRLGLEEVPKQAAAPAEKSTQAVSVKKKGFLDDFLQIRVVDGDVITYRKHWFILLAKIWPLAVVLFILFWIIIARALSVILYLTAWNFVAIFLAILVGSCPYWLYHYWDWKDDRYQLTNREVIDLERKPFQKEARDSAPLENILSIQNQRDNLIKLIFNFGTVAINAGSKELTFDNIYNPAAVQNEIFEHRLRRVNEINDEKERGTRAHIEKLVDYYAENLPEYLEKKQKDTPER